MALGNKNLIKFGHILFENSLSSNYFFYVRVLIFSTTNK